MTVKGVRGRVLSGEVKGEIKQKEKKIKSGLNWVLQIKGVGRDSDRQRR